MYNRVSSGVNPFFTIHNNKDTFIKDIFMKSFDKIPTEYKKKVMKVLVDKTEIKKFLTEDVISKIMA